MPSPLLPVYARADLSFERGDGVWLTTQEGERYLDFGGGVAVASLGYSHPHLVETLRAQAGKLWHTSNLYRIPEGERLAERLAEATFAEVVFFTNSGAEANEAAIKMARKYQSASGHPERFRIVTFEGAFHGRTLATIAAGGQQKYLDGFGPKVDGFDQVPFGDREALLAAIGPETAALMIEPIQGEGGVRIVLPQDLRDLRDLCNAHGLLLIFDEVQTRGRAHGHILRPRAERRHARHHGGRQGDRWRLPARRVSRHARGRQGHDSGHPWHDLRGQSPGHERR